MRLSVQELKELIKDIIRMEPDLTGRADKKQKDYDDVDQDQLAIGTEIEFEHTKDPSVAGQIALDHLSEYDDYYAELTKMEDELAAEEKGEKDDLSFQSMLSDDDDEMEEESFLKEEEENIDTEELTDLVLQVYTDLKDQGVDYQEIRKELTDLLFSYGAKDTLEIDDIIDTIMTGEDE
jgi:hypothetical protein